MLPKLQIRRYRSEYFYRIETFFSNKVDLKTDFDVFLEKYNRNLQRDYCWTSLQQTEFINSIILDRHIPPICIVEFSGNYLKKDFRNHDIPEDDFFKFKYKIIDGKQRLITHKKFIENEFSISFDNVSYFFKDLPKEYQRHITNYEYRCVFITFRHFEDCTDNDLLEMFRWCNYAGTQLEREYLDNFK